MKKGSLYIKVYDVNILIFQNSTINGLCTFNSYHSMKELVTTKGYEKKKKNGMQLKKV
jgi:hypothetical protein